MIPLFRASVAPHASRVPAQGRGAARAVRAALGYLPAQVVLFALAYFAFARAGLMFAVQPEAITAVWPASGLYLGVLLLTVRTRWPAFVAAAFVETSPPT